MSLSNKSSMSDEGARKARKKVIFANGKSKRIAFFFGDFF